MCTACVVNLPRHVLTAHPLSLPPAPRLRQVRRKMLCALCPAVATCRLDQHARSKHGFAGEELAAFLQAAAPAAGRVVDAPLMSEQAQRAVVDYHHAFLDRATGVRRSDASIEHLRSAMMALLPALTREHIVALGEAGVRGGLIDQMLATQR